LLRLHAMLFLFLVLNRPAVAGPPEDAAFFEKQVRPVLVEKCLGCHGPDKQKGGLRLDTRAAVLTGGDRGPAVVAGKPAESLLIAALGHGDAVKMPPKNKLPEAEIAALTEWVRRGVPWPDAAPTTTITKAGERVFTAEEKAFWAFQHLATPAVPAAAPLTRNPIDAFVQAKLREKGLDPSPEADRRTLLRRLSFDLTGLPPTPSEIDAFLADARPDAYERLVDRLLASPAYGEKWGRRWLDVARYADSNGMDENLAYVNAWRYRDYVIRSFNADKPYDRFVTEQLAGDLLPGDDPDRLIATGFLVVGPKMLAEDDPVKMRMDIIDEQLDTVGQAVLGLTLGCARCHDHKFDPVTVGDYYGLAGLFYSTKTMRNYSVVAQWHERPLPGADAAPLAEHEKRVEAARAALAAVQKQAATATAARLAEERKRAAEYAAAAVEVHRRGGVLRLVADPGKETPDGTLRVEAEAFTRGNAAKHTDGYGAGIGVILNAGPMPNVAEYDVTIPKAATYQLAVRYAAAEARPVRVLIDGKPVATAACGTTTGSWYPDTQRWAAEANVALPAGKVTVRLERDGPFPHLDRFVLVPLTHEQAAAAPLSIEQAAVERKLLASILRQWVAAVAKSDGKAPDGDGPFEATPDVEAETQAARGAELKRLRDALAAVEKARPAVPETMAVEDDKGQDLRVHLRGNHTTLGAVAPRRLPRVLAGEATLALDEKRSGRLEFARWLTRPDHPLTARVMANRVWAGHFGRGLVGTPDNFGRLGERPSHPELLDWLAGEFVRSGWSVKHLHRLVVTSATYRQATPAGERAKLIDPENRLLSHFSRRRLDAEEVRDGLLAVSGRLDRTMGGTLLQATPRQYVTSTANKNYEGYAVPRRSVYLPVIRSAVFDVLQTLDFPDPSVPLGQRTATTIPTQALLMLNSRLADQAAEALAKAVVATPGTDADRVREAYHRVYGRPPTTAETERVLAFLKAADGPQAWRGLCRVLLASNEFVFVE